MTIEEAIALLQRIIKLELYHVDYKRTVELADLYFTLITGEGCDALLKRYGAREDAEAFEQRVALTEHIVKPVAETLMSPFQRVGRLDNLKRIITYPGNNQETRVTQLEGYLSNFNGEKSLDDYVQTDFCDFSFMDPNAWLIIEFDPFDRFTETARPYPVIAFSESAIHFNYIKGELQYLVVRDPINYQTKKVDSMGDFVTINGFKYTMYLKNDIITYTQVENVNFILEGDPIGDNGQAPFVAEKKRHFVLNLYNPKGGEVQARRIGYKKDKYTKNRTYVNPFDAAIPFFRKTLKAVSEMDITMARHAFPQKLMYADACPGVPENICQDGLNREGTTCTKCNGSGKFIPVSAQDVYVVQRPRDNFDKTIALDKQVVYVYPPVELLKFQDEYIEKLERKATRAVFNSDILKVTTFAQTATERLENKDELYNTIHPYAENLSLVWRWSTKLVATFTDNADGLQLTYKLPSDYKLKSVRELLEDQKAAKDSGAPAFVTQELSRDIAAKLFADDPFSFLKFQVKSKFTPFLGKSEEQIAMILASPECIQVHKILWIYSDSIFDELEQENRDFFYMTYEKQNAMVMEKVQNLISQIPAPPRVLPFNPNMEDQEDFETSTTV